MSRVHRVGVLAAGVSTGKTYAQFQARVAALATDGVRAWGDTTAMPSAAAYRTTAASVTGAMTGTSWLSFTDSGVPPGRAIQHGLPTADVFSAQISGGLEIFFRVSDPGDKISFAGLNRNGYASLSYNDGNPYPARVFTEIIYWDDGPKRMQPSVGLGPVPYDW